MGKVRMMAAALAALVLPVVAHGADAARAGSVSFTAAQAKHGGELYEANCSACHQNDLNGAGPVPGLKGQIFDTHWLGHPVGEFYTRISNTMPADDPGKLAPEDYAEIAAYLLQMNGFKPSGAVLGHDTVLLDKIRIPKK